MPVTEMKVSPNLYQVHVHRSVRIDTLPIRWPDMCIVIYQQRDPV